MEGILHNAPKDTIVLFEDETEVHLNPTISKCWSESGIQVKVESARNDERYQVFGSVNYYTGDLVYIQEERKTTAQFVFHIEQILSRWSESPVVLICDNYSVHKTKAVKELERKHFGRLLLVYLPTYSPHMNPIEMLWRHIRRLVTHNSWFGCLSALMVAVASALDGLTSDSILGIIGGSPRPNAETT